MSTNCCDYGCDRSFNCPAGSARAECHVPCTPPARQRAFLAPGVLDGPHRRRRVMTVERADAIGRAVLFMVVLAAVAGAFGFVVGYVEVVGLLP